MTATAAARADKMSERRRGERIQFESIECFHYRLGAGKEESAGCRNPG
jgi:hypothetical protein